MIQTAAPTLLDPSPDATLDALVAEYFDEPIGIVISSGSRAEPTPRVAEYVWGPVPDEGMPATSGTPHAA
ncbi:MAG: hypothetical protein ACO31W_09080 [Gemmatimonadaceae bacterium]|jgi:hypothetical protein